MTKTISSLPLSDKTATSGSLGSVASDEPEDGERNTDSTNGFLSQLGLIL